jgi:hypothetical protein
MYATLYASGFHLKKPCREFSAALILQIFQDNENAKTVVYQNIRLPDE